MLMVRRRSRLDQEQQAVTVSQTRKILALAMLTLASACAAKPVTISPKDPTSELRTWTLTQRSGQLKPCGEIPSFTGAATQLCDRLEYQSATEIGCAEGYIKWLDLEPELDSQGARRGLLQIVSDTCDAAYDVVGVAPQGTAWPEAHSDDAASADPWR
jgi:hypothetical protein